MKNREANVIFFFQASDFIDFLLAATLAIHDCPFPILSFSFLQFDGALFELLSCPIATA